MREYESSDYCSLKKWFLERKLPIPKPSDLPNIGFIEDFVAAGFIIATDCNYAIIDFYISNSKAPKSDRDNALQSITKCLIKKAKMMGFKKVCFTTKLETIIKLGRTNSFYDVGNFRFMVKEI